MKYIACLKAENIFIANAAEEICCFDYLQWASDIKLAHRFSYIPEVTETLYGFNLTHIIFLTEDEALIKNILD